MTIPPLLSKYLKKLTPKGGGTEVHPSRDWLMLLLLTGLLLLVSVGWNIWFFASVLQGEEVAPSVGGETPTEESALQRAKASFEARALEEARYRSEYRFVDPSR